MDSFPQSMPKPTRAVRTNAARLTTIAMTVVATTRRSVAGVTGVLAGLGLGAIVLVGLAVLVCGGGGALIWYLASGRGVTDTFAISPTPDRKVERFYDARAGQRIGVTVSSNAKGLQPNITIQVLRNNGVVADNKGLGGNQSLECIAPVHGRYMVRIINRGPGIANSQVSVNIR
jgi:hypothetical protein